MYIKTFAGLTTNNYFSGFKRNTNAVVIAIILKDTNKNEITCRIYVDFFISKY